MPIICVSELVANPTATPIPGAVELRFDVQVNGNIDVFQVQYRILTSTGLVRFASGRPEETVAFNVNAAQMSVIHRPTFVCADPNQNVNGFVSFTVEARVFVGARLHCTPNSHPAIRVTAWSCRGEGGAGAFTILEGTAEPLA